MKRKAKRESAHAIWVLIWRTRCESVTARELINFPNPILKSVSFVGHAEISASLGFNQGCRMHSLEPSSLLWFREMEPLTWREMLRRISLIWTLSFWRGLIFCRSCPSSEEIDPFEVSSCVVACWLLECVHACALVWGKLEERDDFSKTDRLLFRFELWVSVMCLNPFTACIWVMGRNTIWQFLSLGWFGTGTAPEGNQFDANSKSALR